MLAVVGGVVAGLVQLGLTIGIFAAAGFAADWTYRRTKRKTAAWAAGIAGFILLGLALWPTIDALMKVSCATADDFEACMDGDNDRDFM